jgi:hypothetical protein
MTAPIRRCIVRNEIDSLNYELEIRHGICTFLRIREARDSVVTTQVIADEEMLHHAENAWALEHPSDRLHAFAAVMDGLKGLEAYRDDGFVVPAMVFGM